MGRAGRTRQERREEPTPRPIALPAAAEANTAAEKSLAEMRTTTAPLPKKRTDRHKTKARSQRQKDAAEKAAEFSERLAAKADRRETRKAKKDTAKRLWE